MQRYLMLLGATLLLAGCDSTPEAKAPPADPAALAGSYELWICGTAECGPAATAPGSRVGRLLLTADRLPPTPTDSSISYRGCATIGPLVKVDTVTALTPISWRAGETAGRVMFGMNETANSEYEIALDELGGIFKGQARWRRDGIISEEAPEFVVARRNPVGEKLACAAPAAASPSAAEPVATSSTATPKAAGKATTKNKG